MFENCEKITVHLFSENHALYINHDSHWIYLCLQAAKMLRPDFMNELTITLKEQHHMIVKWFSIFPGRADGKVVDVLCISFEQDHEEIERLVSNVAKVPEQITRQAMAYGGSVR